MSTISLSLANIPVYLLQSDFYLNLDKSNGGEIEVPEDCFHSKDSVENVKDLEGLLKTLDFWGVRRAPPLLLDYVDSEVDDVSVYWPVMEKYEDGLPFLALMGPYRVDEKQQDAYLHAIKKKNVTLLKACLRLGQYPNLDTMKALFCRGWLEACQLVFQKMEVGDRPKYSTSDKIDEIQRLVVQSGNLNVLNMLMHTPTLFQKRDLDEMQRFCVNENKMEMFQMLVQKNDGVISHRAMEAARQNEREAFLWFAIEQGSKVSDSVLFNLLDTSRYNKTSEKIDVIQRILASGRFPTDAPKLFLKLVALGSLSLIELAVQQGCVIPPEAIQEVVQIAQVDGLHRYGYFPATALHAVLLYFTQHGASWEGVTCDKLKYAPDVATLQLARHKEITIWGQIVRPLFHPHETRLPHNQQIEKGSESLFRREERK